MADCELLGDCLFYDKRIPMDDNLWAYFVKLYCKGNYTKCGRYMVATALGLERVSIPGHSGHPFQSNPDTCSV
jgi:hypothetical protein